MSSGALDRGIVAGLVAATAGAAASVMVAHSPALADIASGDASDSAVHLGALAGLGTAVAIGGAVAVAAGHAGPLLAALAIALAMVALYEWLRARSPSAGRG